MEIYKVIIIGSSNLASLEDNQTHNREVLMSSNNTRQTYFIINNQNIYFNKDTTSNDKINYRDLTESRILVFSSDISDENDPPISSESNWNSDDDVYSTDDNKHRGEETLTRSKNLRTYNRWDQTNHVNKQPAIIDTTTSSSDELPEIPNSPAPNQRVFKSAKV
ncbi:unnamed protein product [Rotaria sp. Silwood1]|nr:unnamed protein product [Rotaria sp. Silwood1]